METASQILGADNTEAQLEGNRLAEMYIESGKFNEAEQLYKKQFEVNKQKDPQGIPTYDSISNLTALYFRWAKPLQSLPYIEFVIANTSVVKNDPKLLQSEYTEMISLCMSGQDYDKAESYGIRALQTCTYDPIELRILLAQIHTEQGKASEAEFESLIELTKDDEPNSGRRDKIFDSYSKLLLKRTKAREANADGRQPG